MSWIDYVTVAGLEALMVGIGLLIWKLFRKALSIVGLALLVTGFLLQAFIAAMD
jgi:hypothetical protein